MWIDCRTGVGFGSEHDPEEEADGGMVLSTSVEELSARTDLPPRCLEALKSLRANTGTILVAFPCASIRITCGQ